MLTLAVMAGQAWQLAAMRGALPVRALGLLLAGSLLRRPAARQRILVP